MVNTPLLQYQILPSGTTQFLNENSRPVEKLTLKAMEFIDPPGTRAFALHHAKTGEELRGAV